MIKRNCAWCGKYAPEGRFCGRPCEQSYAGMMSKPHRAFRSHLQASKYLGRDVRTIRKYEGVLYVVDRSLPNPQIKQLPCKVCGSLCKTGENRRGYCPACSEAGEGRKAQARLLAELHAGANNPNYVDGGVKQTFRHRRVGKEWSGAVRARDGRCQCCGGRCDLNRSMQHGRV